MKSVLMILTSVALCGGCYIVDDDNINALCTAECTTVKGRFVTGDGTVPVENMPLHLRWGTSNGFTGRSRDIAIAQTDKNEAYEITFHAKPEELTTGLFSLVYEVPKGTYMSRKDRNFVKFAIDQRDTTIVYDFLLPKIESFIHLAITNPEDIGPDDRMAVGLSYKFGYIPGRIRRGLGGLRHPYVTDTTYATASDHFTYIDVTRWKNGEYWNKQDSVVIRSGETLKYEVTF